MGAEVLAMSQVGMGLAQGYAGYTAGQAQGSMFESDAIRIEGEAERESTRVIKEGERFAAEQKMAYIGSGVEIGGSAVVTLAQTDKWARAEAENVRDRGKAVGDYYRRSGALARRKGMADFITGVAGGIASGASVYSTARQPASDGKAGSTSTSRAGGDHNIQWTKKYRPAHIKIKASNTRRPRGKSVVYPY